MSDKERRKFQNFKKRKKLINRYPVLTNKDEIYNSGEKDQLISHLQEKLGKSKKEIKEILNKL